jgi:hypothetical protein
VATDGAGSLSLTWSPSGGASSYNLFEGTGAGKETSTPIVTGLSAGSTTVNNLTAGQQYFFTVSAVDAGGTSAQSAEASGTVIPAAPSGLAGTAGNGTVSLAWTTAQGASSYNVYEGTSMGNENSAPVQTGLMSARASIVGLQNATSYFFRVTAVNAGGTSAMSNEATATPIAPKSSGGGGSMDWLGLALLALLAGRPTRRNASLIHAAPSTAAPPQS